MERRLILCAACVLGLATSGCGSSTTATNESRAAAWVEDVAPPDVSVREFLEAVRTGNDERASEMLTVVARQETQKHELVVAPPGSDTAKFEIGRVEIVEKEVAHVASVWTDIGEDGQPHSDEIIWMLRRDPGGWRIAGMATKIFKDELPLLLDFEDPEDMIRKQQLAEQEMQRRAAAEAGTPAVGTPDVQAAKPGPPVPANKLRQ